MKTFNGNKELKTELLTQLKHHEKLDAFVQGEWLRKSEGKIDGNGFKGCFYGCTMQTEEKPLTKFSEKYNIDLWYVYVTEKIFEGLPKGESKKFPYESISILPIGVDINKIKSMFHCKVLESQLAFCKNNKPVTEAIKLCMELFSVPYNEISESAAESAAWSAESAAESAAWSADSAWSAASSAESAAWSAESAAWSAWSDYYSFLRDTLFNCIKEVYEK